MINALSEFIKISNNFYYCVTGMNQKIFQITHRAICHLRPRPLPDLLAGAPLVCARANFPHCRAHESKKSMFIIFLDYEHKISTKHYEIQTLLAIFSEASSLNKLINHFEEGGINIAWTALRRPGEAVKYDSHHSAKIVGVTSLMCVNVNQRPSKIKIKSH